MYRLLWSWQVPTNAPLSVHMGSSISSSWPIAVLTARWVAKGFIGMLLSLTHSSQPNILYTTTYLSHFINMFNDSHAMAIKCVMRYLVITHNQVICYNKSLINQHDSATLIPVGYTNTDWGNTNTDNTPSQASFFLLTGGPISWTSKTQQFVALSSTKANIKALFLHHLTPAFGRDSLMRSTLSMSVGSTRVSMASSRLPYYGTRPLTSTSGQVASIPPMAILVSTFSKWGGGDWQSSPSISTTRSFLLFHLAVYYS